MRHNAADKGKKQKPLSELQQNIQKPEVIDLSKYKLPNAYGMSPNTKKLLKMNMTCSDGFEGRETQPAGRTMPMRLPRRHPQVFRQAFARVPELTLTSSRDLTENIGGPRGLQGEQLQSNTIAMFYHEDSDIVTDALAPLMQQLPGSLEDRNKLPRPEGTSQLRKLTKLIPPYGDYVDAEEIAKVTAPPTICRLKRRVTFSKDVEVLQTLMMISAPIAMTSPCDSDDSEHGTIDDDRNSSGSSDEDRSEGDAEGGSGDHRGSEEGNSDDETNAEGAEVLQHPPASVKATQQSLRHTEEPLEDNKHGEAQISRRLALNDEIARRDSVYNSDMNQNTCSPNASYVQFPKGRGEALITRESHQKHKITERDPWRPRRPVSTCRLIEVDDDILDYPSSPTELSMGGDERGLFHSAGARKREIQSWDDCHTYRIRADNEYMEDPRERKQSQASVELGDPNWSVPYGHEDEQSYSQAQNPDHPLGRFRRYVVEEYPTYLVRAIDSFRNPSQGSFSLARSKSMPPNRRFHYVAEQIQEDPVTENLEISQVFKYTVSPLKRTLSQMQSMDLISLTRRMSNEAGTTPIRRRIQPLSFIPPFLRD